MPGVKQALIWNLLSSPFRIASGLLYTAVIARVLTLNGQMTDLGTYAVLAACAGTIVFVTNFGMPQVFSRVVADIAQRKEQAALRRFMKATIVLRCIVWSAIAAISLSLLLAFGYIHRVNLIQMYGGWSVIAAAAVWTAAMDIAGYGNRALSALYEQKWQNAIIILTQLAGAAVTASGFLVPENALLLAVTGTALSLAGRAVLFIAAFQRLTPATPGPGSADPLLRLWRQELGQTGWAGAEKLTQYFQTPSFVLIVIGSLAGREAIGIAFLILDLGAKIIAAISTAFSGLVLPAMSRAGAEEKLQSVYASAVIFQSSVGGLLMAGVGAFGAMILLLLTGRSVSVSPGLVGFVLGAIVYEFIMLDLTGSVLLVQKKIQRMIFFKLASVATGLLCMFIVSMLGGQLTGLLTTLFLVRVAFSCAAPNLCELERSWHARQLAVLLGILVLAPAFAQITYGLHLSQLTHVLLNLTGLLVMIAISHGIFLREETLFTVRSLRQTSE